MERRRRSMPWSWLALALLTGCSGGQTGGEGHAVQCVSSEPKVVAFSDTSHIGFSAEDVLAFVEGEHTSDARWPFIDSAPAEASLRVTRATKHARFVEAHWPIPRADEGCRSRLEVDVSVELTLTNARGTTRALFDAVLFATSAGEARIQQMLSPEDFTGELQFPLRAQDRLDHVELLAQFAPDRSSGQLIASASEPIQADGYVYRRERSGTAASWPTSDACGDGGQLVALAGFELGLPLEEIVYQLPRQLDVEWSDGTSTTATLQITAAGLACITDACDVWCPDELHGEDGAAERRTAVVLPVQIGIVTDDARWKGSFVAELWIEMFDHGALAAAYLRYDSQRASSDAVKDDLGLEGVSLDGDLTAVLLLEYTDVPPPPDLYFDDLPASGSLVVSDSDGAIMTTHLASPAMEPAEMQRPAGDKPPP